MIMGGRVVASFFSGFHSCRKDAKQGEARQEECVALSSNGKWQWIDSTPQKRASNKSLDSTEKSQGLLVV